jgi:hypothetical protein
MQAFFSQRRSAHHSRSPSGRLTHRACEKARNIYFSDYRNIH